jgi:hypothetical protein
VAALPERASGDPAADAQAGVPMVIMTLVHTCLRQGHDHATVTPRTTIVIMGLMCI